nr:putative ribonuclease H-like domain-containing protein [Tanacetum cinerariifolium]
MADILKKFDFSTVKTASTLMEPKKALIKDAKAEDVDVHLYRSMIESLIYLTASRPGIMFVVCTCARFQVTPKTSHLHAMNRIFRYLKGQPKLGLWYPRDSPFDLKAFSYSDYGRAILDRKSTTGGCQFLGKRLISWQCKNQTMVTNSSTEAEYVAATNCCGHFWASAKSKTVNDVKQIHAKVDGNTVVVEPGAMLPHWGIPMLKLGLTTVESSKGALGINNRMGKGNAKGRGSEWLFDIDSLTKSMNYELVIARNQTNNDTDDKDADEAPGKGDKGVSKRSGIDNQERFDISTQDINTAESSINTANTNINTEAIKYINDPIIDLYKCTSISSASAYLINALLGSIEVLSVFILLIRFALMMSFLRSNGSRSFGSPPELSLYLLGGALGSRTREMLS